MVFDFAKWCINDRCNLSCPFCCMDNTYEELSFAHKCRVIDKLFGMGVSHIDFFGKEVLVDDEFFRLWDYIYKENYPFTLSFITNGVNLTKYKEDILTRAIKYGNLSQMAVSYDFGTSRTYNVSTDVLKPFIEAGIFTEFSIDLQEDNVDLIPDFIQQGHSNSVYIKPIIPHGLRSDYAKSVMVTRQNLNNLIITLNGVILNSFVTVSLPFIIPSKSMPKSTNGKLRITNDDKCLCGDTLFITSDGNVYGCGDVALTRSERFCSFLETPAEEIHKHICKQGRKRECIV